MNLDEVLQEQFTVENYKNFFESLVESKTDSYTNCIKLPMGVDGIKYDNIKKNIVQISNSVCKRAQKGTYIFSPFREIQIPKAPYTKNEFRQAKNDGKLRTLAICTINDTIFQNMIYKAIYDYTENKYYKEIDDNVFGYRKGKSVNLAIDKIRQCIKQGYTFGLDGDIEKYFDMINHDKLIAKIKHFYGNNTMVSKYISRFVHVKKVAIKDKKQVAIYHNKKPITTPRFLGIPQGGVLSGLLANIYLYNFDNYVIKRLSKIYDIKYFRYADDFIILTKEPTNIITLYKKIKSYLKREKLNLHEIDTSAIDDSQPNSNKTKAINLNNQHYIDFLGFRISPTYLSIKEDNVIKFKKNIKHIISLALHNKNDLQSVIYKINAKILGNGIYGHGLFVPCKACNNPQKPQSWVGFFINITDMRTFKVLDIWIRKQLFKFYNKINSGKHLPKKVFRKQYGSKRDFCFYNLNLQSLFNTAVNIKQWYKKYPNATFCDCKKYIPDYDISLS